MVRMLCRRSASLMTSTRMSSAMATSILRMAAACWASFESKWMRSSLVTPSTNAATSAPNSFSMSASVNAVSSATSCRRAATIVVSSRPKWATIVATANGWVMYGSPERRICPSCAASATSYARWISSEDAFGCALRNCSTRGPTFSAAGSWWRRHGRTRVTAGIGRRDS